MPLTPVEQLPRMKVKRRNISVAEWQKWMRLLGGDDAHRRGEFGWKLVDIGFVSRNKNGRTGTLVFARFHDKDKYVHWCDGSRFRIYK